jgi:hypothetical protein
MQESKDSGEWGKGKVEGDGGKCALEVIFRCWVSFTWYSFSFLF